MSFAGNIKAATMLSLGSRQIDLKDPPKFL